MRQDQLKRLILQYQKSMNYYKDKKNAYNEQSCRDEYISPLLECFGWDVPNAKGKLPQYKEVVVEQFSNSSERPDYTLTLNGVSKMFVEAKKPSVDISVDIESSMQARKYGWNAKHTLVILTNFENMIVYDTTNKPKDGDEVNTSVFRKYNFMEYAEKYKEIYDLISRENVYNGKYDEFTKSNFQDENRFHTEVDDTFLEQINKWRLRLGKYLYAKDSKYQNINVLNDTVQDFINQVVFLRICEDRNLPLYAKLHEVATNKENLQSLLTQVFKEADKRYNSGLFKGETPIFDLNSDIIFEIIMSLYYPATPYLFTIIEPGILGRIYEAFLTECLIVVDQNVELAKKNEYMYKSVVSTPTEIVKYMVKNTLESICESKSPIEILDLRVIDIACGSGVFLEEAYQYLVDYCTQWYEINEPEYLLEMSSGKHKLPIEKKKAILKSCIYGIDIDIHAVEVSKFSLILKLIEDETEPSVKNVTPILPELSTNIMHGNSLIADEDIEGINISTKELLEIVPFDWSEINSGRKFDVVLGNPPYVKTEDMRSLVNKIEFDIYKRKYSSAYKQFDKYFLFVEKSLEILKDSGVLCYIIPNKFYKIVAGKELRKLICKKIKKLDDFGDAQLFPDKTIYSSIVKIGKIECDEMNYFHVSSLAELWSGEESQSVKIKNDKLNQDPWSLSTDIEFLKILSDLEGKTIPLSSVANVFNGIQTSAERAEDFSDKKEVYWFDESCIVEENEQEVRINKFGSEYKIEKSLLKPYFKPTKKNEKGMKTYSILKTDKRIIFPYDSKGKLIEKNVMTREYPGIFQYLEDCYDRLVPKCLNDGIGRDISDATEDTWYKYGRTQALTAFINTPKLIVRVLSKEPMYAYDNSDMLIASGGTAGYCAISELSESNYSLEYIQACLLHPFTEKIFQMKGSDFEGGFTARGTFILKKIPIVNLDFEDEKQRDLYNTVVSNTKRIYELNYEMEKKADKATLNILEKEKNKLVNQNEQLITRVYQQKF